MLGQTISHYKILEKIGEGGMGEVYRATDTKLGREVALKILPEQFASDSQRMGRFQREAEVLASLDHPNIGQIFGIEEAGQTKALVLQLIEEPTLAERIAQGPIPVEETFKIALQIAEGLEAAHEKGVIHRDLKPANIKITPEGQVKILDFGLAKAFSGDESDVSLSNSPTLSLAATQQGVILGTAAYMSPEQARGHALDKRTDIWAFGCVVYEMLSGRAAFPGDDITDILAAVVRAEPVWSALPEGSHPRLRELLERCLEKDERNRRHDIADVRIDLEKIQEDPDSRRIEPPGVGHGLSGSLLTWGVMTFVLGALLAGFAAWNLVPRPAADSRTVRFSFDVPSQAQTRVQCPWSRAASQSLPTASGLPTSGLVPKISKTPRPSRSGRFTYAPWKSPTAHQFPEPKVQRTFFFSRQRVGRIRRRWEAPESTHCRRSAAGYHQGIGSLRCGLGTR